MAWRVVRRSTRHAWTCVRELVGFIWATGMTANHQQVSPHWRAATISEIDRARRHEQPCLDSDHVLDAPRVRHPVVNGRVVVRDAKLTSMELPQPVERHNCLAADLAVAAACNR